MSRRRRPLAALAVVALIGAGCSNEPAEDGNASNTNADYENAVEFAECIRDNSLMPAVRASRMPPTVALRTV
jgi:hypothetical protein